MTTNFKAIIIADAHIGADKFDTHPDRWDAPVREAFNYAVEAHADVVISSGDFMHKRNPTIAELLRRRELLAILEAAAIAFVEVPGNHDKSNAEGSHSALEIESTYLMQGAVHSMQFGQVKLIALPWPRPTDYLNDEAMKLPIDEKIGITRNIILNTISDIMGRSTEQPVILFGHSMLAYGPNHDQLGQDPGLILGKDVVLPYQAFLDAGLTENQTFFGHVHDPKSPGYVGSTQPTDWSDAEHDKSFVELDIEKCEMPEDGQNWHYHVTRHSYSDQIRLHDIVLGPDLPGLHLKDTPVDVARLTINVGEGEILNEEVIRMMIDQAPNYARLERVIVNHPKREAARVETEVAMADMPPQEAFALWMEQAGYSAEEAKAPYKEFESLIESAK